MFLLYWRFTVLYILNKRFANNTKAFSVVLTHKNLFVCGVTHFESKNQIVYLLFGTLTQIATKKYCINCLLGAMVQHAKPASVLTVFAVRLCRRKTKRCNVFFQTVVTFWYANRCFSWRFVVWKWCKCICFPCRKLQKHKNFFALYLQTCLFVQCTKPFNFSREKATKNRFCFESFAVKSYLSTLHCFRPLCQA